MPFSHIQVAYQKEGDIEMLMLKNDPSSRKLCTLDRRRKDALNFVMLTPDRILVQLKGDSRCYWSLMNSHGEVLEIPGDLKRILDKF